MLFHVKIISMESESCMDRPLLTRRWMKEAQNFGIQTIQTYPARLIKIRSAACGLLPNFLARSHKYAQKTHYLHILFIA